MFTCDNCGYGIVQNKSHCNSCNNQTEVLGVSTENLIEKSKFSMLVEDKKVINLKKYLILCFILLLPVIAGAMIFPITSLFFILFLIYIGYLIHILLFESQIYSKFNNSITWKYY